MAPMLVLHILITLDFHLMWHLIMMVIVSFTETTKHSLENNEIYDLSLMDLMMETIISLREIIFRLKMHVRLHQVLMQVKIMITWLLNETSDDNDGDSNP